MRRFACQPIHTSCYVLPRGAAVLQWAWASASSLPQPKVTYFCKVNTQPSRLSGMIWSWSNARGSTCLGPKRALLFTLLAQASI